MQRAVCMVHRTATSQYHLQLKNDFSVENIPGRNPIFQDNTDSSRTVPGFPELSMKF